MTGAGVGRFRAVPRLSRTSVVLAAAAVGLGLLALHWPASSQDEAILLVFPERVLAGGLPYRDFSTAYGPGGWWALAGVFAVFGPSVVIERAVGIAVHAVLALSMARLVGGQSPTLRVVTGLTTLVVLFPLGDAPYAWLVAAALAATGTATLMGGTGRRRQVLSGLLAGLAISWRPDVCLLASLPPLALLRGSPDRKCWFFGLGLGTLPLFGAALAAPFGFIHDVVLGRILGSATQSRLPLPPAEMTLKLLLASTVAISAVLLARAISSRDRENWSLALVAILSLPQGLQRADSTHLLYSGALVLPLMPLLVSDGVTRWLGAARARLVAPGLGLLAVGVVAAGPVLVPLTLVATGRGPTSVWLHHDGRAIPESPGRARVMTALLKKLDAASRPGDELFVFPADFARPGVSEIWIYHLMPSLATHARNIEITPGVTNQRASHVLEDLQRADLVVLVDDSDVIDQLLPFEERSPYDPTSITRQTYCVLGVVDFYEVLGTRGSGRAPACRRGSPMPALSPGAARSSVRR